jgi:predicted ATPase
MDLLDIDEEARTLGLAEICHRRTGGNVFFLISFISMLKEKGLLDYNFGLTRWT